METCDREIAALTVRQTLPLRQGRGVCVCACVCLKVCRAEWRFPWDAVLPRSPEGGGVKEVGRGRRQIKLRCVAESDPASQPPDDSAALEGEEEEEGFLIFTTPLYLQN